ncbi:MAG: radical SAM protein [Terriglobales bacterium]|jgi:radical SAM protein with 4Fe4S-binding SPASM domain
MSDEVWDQYPVLTVGNEIHLNPLGGTLFVQGEPFKVIPAVAEFLSKCDGQRTLRDAVPSSWNHDFEDVEFIGFAARAVDSGWLELRDVPVPHSARITGSRTAFYPPHMSIELIERCNLRCDYCYRESDHSKTGHMPTTDLLDLIGRLCDAGLRTVELTGGEPMLHPHFSQVLDFCASRMELVGVLSNGTVLGSDVAEQLAAMREQLIFSVSLDASTAEMHDARRGVKGAWLLTTRNIARLAALGVGCRVSMAVDERNFADIEKTLLLARSLGARLFSYSPVLPFGRGKNVYSTNWRLRGKDVLAREAELAARYRGFLGVLTGDAVCEVEGEGGCGAGHRTFCMDPFGNIRPCATFGPRELIFGNLLRQPMDEVFSHPAISAMRKLRTPSPDFCGPCEHLGFCSYCPLRGLHAGESRPDCAWRKQNAVAEILPVWSRPE